MTEPTTETPETTTPDRIVIVDTLFIRDMAKYRNELVAEGLERLSLPQLTIRLANRALAQEE